MTGSGRLVPGLSLDSLPESCIVYSDGARLYIAVKVAQPPPPITSAYIEAIAGGIRRAVLRLQPPKWVHGARSADRGKLGFPRAEKPSAQAAPAPERYQGHKP